MKATPDTKLGLYRIDHCSRWRAPATSALRPTLTSGLDPETDVRSVNQCCYPLQLWGQRMATNPGSESHSFRFAVKLRNSAGVLPQLDITTVGHLLSALLRRVVIDAREVDSFDVMALTGNKIRSRMWHSLRSLIWREHAGLSVTDGSQQQTMIESTCTAFIFTTRPNGRLSLLAAAALAATLSAALTGDRSGSRACWGGRSRGLRGGWLLRHRLWRSVPSWFLSWPMLLFGPRLFLRPTMLFGLWLLLNCSTLLFSPRLFLRSTMLFGLWLLLNCSTLPFSFHHT